MLLDLVIQIEEYMTSKGLNSSETTVSDLLDMMNGDGLEEL